MKKQYKHLTEFQRYEIQALRAQNMSQAKIADHLGVNKSTVSRELGRNSKNTARGTTYDAEFAQRIADKRRELKPRRGGMTYEIERRIRWLLKRGWSPEQINGTCKKRNIPMLSHEAIYLWIYERKRKGEDLTVHLRRKRKKRRNRALTKGRRVIIKDKTPIEQRPAAVAEQSRIGDFEVDLVKCKNGYFLTRTERKTLFNLIEKIPNKTATETRKALIKALKPYGHILKTITSDNGTEFAEHKAAAKALNVDWYFANPYRSCERGCNENQNGLIRQFAGRKLDLNEISDETVKIWQKTLNYRPRKKLNFDKPIDHFKRAVALQT